VFNTIRVVYSLPETSLDEELEEDHEHEQPETEEETPEDPLPFNFHFWDSSVKEEEYNDNFVFLNQHTDNTSKGPVDSQPSPTPRNSPKPTNQHLVTQSMDLQYDIIDDLKKQRENISMFDLLKIYPMPGGSILSNLTTSSNTNSRRNHPSVP